MWGVNSTTQWLPMGHLCASCCFPQIYSLCSKKLLNSQDLLPIHNYHYLLLSLPHLQMWREQCHTERVRPWATVALMVLLDSCGLLNLLPSPLIGWQLRDGPLNVVEKLIPKTSHEYNNIEPLERLPPPCPICIVDCHHGHSESHEATVLPHDPFRVLSNVLLLVLGEPTKDVGRLFQGCPSDPMFLKLVTEICEGHEHAAAGSIILHYSLEPGQSAGWIMPVGNRVRHKLPPNEPTSPLAFTRADALLGDVGLEDCEPVLGFVAYICLLLCKFGDVYLGSCHLVIVGLNWHGRQCPRWWWQRLVVGVRVVATTTVVSVVWFLVS